MWLVYAALHMFFMALVNYSDEYLTHSSSIKKLASLHERIGGVLIMSVFMCVIGIAVLGFLVPDKTLTETGLMLTLVSSLTMVTVWIGYFYFFQIFSAHQVVPLFGLSSIWLLLIELSFGAILSLVGLGAIGVLILGAYLLDNGSLRMRIPSRLLLGMLPVSLSWAITVFLVRTASHDNDALAIYFWQLIGIFCLGLLLFAFASPYRRGFIKRVCNEKHRFILSSLVNESLAQISFMLGVLATAAAPLAVYFTATGGLQSIFLLALFGLFPLDKRNSVSSVQWLGVFCIAFGIFMLELWK